MPKKILPQAALKELFDYCPDTGVLTWRTRPAEQFKTRRSFNSWNTRFAGKAAGYLGSRGYLLVTLNGEMFLVHRIIYKWIYGTEPYEIDHINGTRDCNSPGNLRAVTHKINSQNQKTPSSNTSGVIGVHWHKNHDKWQAQIRVDGKIIHLGLFDNIEDAATVRQEAEVEHGFHANHGRI